MWLPHMYTQAKKACRHHVHQLVLDTSRQLSFITIATFILVCLCTSVVIATFFLLRHTTAQQVGKNL
jgi:hypothetical protein